MTPDQFKFQMHRLEDTFGAKNFTMERLELIERFCMWMSLGQFSHICDHFISSFRYAPLPKDFKDAAIREKKNSFEKEVLSTELPFSEGLPSFLEKQYPGCKTLIEAVEVQVLKSKVAKALNGDVPKEPVWPKEIQIRQQASKWLSEQTGTSSLRDVTHAGTPRGDQTDL